MFIDRDGVRFRHVLNYLRTGTLPSFDAAWRYEEVAEEADFFALEALKALAESVRTLQLSVLESRVVELHTGIVR